MLVHVLFISKDRRKYDEASDSAAKEKRGRMSNLQNVRLKSDFYFYLRLMMMQSQANGIYENSSSALCCLFFSCFLMEFNDRNSPLSVTTTCVRFESISFSILMPCRISTRRAICGIVRINLGEKEKGESERDVGRNWILNH